MISSWYGGSGVRNTAGMRNTETAVVGETLPTTIQGVNNFIKNSKKYKVSNDYFIAVNNFITVT